jgi:D-alanyl-D-alanine carboxypeptidase
LVAALAIAGAGCDATGSPKSSGSLAQATTSVTAGTDNTTGTDDWQRRIDAVRSVATTNTEAAAVPGLVVTIADHDRVRTLSFGVSDLRHDTPMRPDDRFRIASITKSMTAAVVLQLAEEGVLDLEDTVERWLPGVLRAGAEITLADLLGHVSGLAEVDDSPFVGRDGVTPAEYVDAIADEPLEAAPGELFVYRNVNYVLLGLVVEAAEGQDLATVMDERLFAPLRMRDTRVASEGRPGPRMVHVYVGVEDLSWLDVYWAAGAGGVTSTAGDVSRFYRALVAGEVVGEEALARMTDVRDDDINFWSGYGLGLATVETDCGTALGHSGRLPGLSTEAWTLPVRERSVVLFVNADWRGALGTLDAVREAALCG